jgi:hypothetical protein
MGISEGRWRRWTLQIIQLLSHQDGSVLDAILLWKKNVDKEFEGIHSSGYDMLCCDSDV